MKKLLAACGCLVLSFAATAGYWDYSIYNYVDSNGNVIGTQYNHCFNNGTTITGSTNGTKVFVEAGSCR